MIKGTEHLRDNMHSRQGESRFAGVFSASCQKPVYDRVLMDLGEHVVIPTLGAIVPGWLLVVPKQYAVNYRQASERSEVDGFAVVRKAIAKLECGGCDVVWFEHGPLSAGSTLGCGVEHAHIHILISPPFSFGAFESEVRTHSPGKWQSEGSSCVYSSIPSDEAYIVFGDRVNALFSSVDEGIGSQFFRRIIANLVGKPASWNYRTHPHIENIDKTISLYGNVK